MTADYLLGLSETKNYPNADLADLRLSDEMIDLLKSGRIAVSYTHLDVYKRQEPTSPMILQKSCHDMDILLWLSGQRCTRAVSYTHLDVYKRQGG